MPPPLLIRREGREGQHAFVSCPSLPSSSFGAACESQSLALRVDFGLSINHSIRRVKPPLAPSPSPFPQSRTAVGMWRGIFRVSQQVKEYLCGILCLKATGKSFILASIHLSVHLKYTTCACGLRTDRTPLRAFLWRPNANSILATMQSPLAVCGN